MPPQGMHLIVVDLQDYYHSYQPYPPNDQYEPYPSNSNRHVHLGTSGEQHHEPFYPLPRGKGYKEPYYFTSQKGYFPCSKGLYFFFCPREYSLPWSKEFLLGPTIVEDEDTIPIGRLKKGIARSSIVKLKKMHNNVVCKQNRAFANQKKMEKAIFYLGNLHQNQ